ncbi:MAG: acyl-CoA/acyl-ACP dehydrogenase [Alcaligenaceae bacterium]|nr:acyl-CoA/acyl-ACP dehydrogenase [Alcaligenaceae bacterium]
MTHNHLSPEQRDGLDAVIAQALAPIVQNVDQQGLYPREFMTRFGRAGGFGAAIPQEYGGLGLGLTDQIDIIAQVAQTCGSSAFLAWCQSACAWYLLHAPNAAPRERYLRPIAQGQLLAGTGMSNAVKHLAGIERINLRGRHADEGGYVINGSLPWVSNIGPGHLVIVAASLQEGGYLMFALPLNAEGVILHDCQEFSGMEGTGTLNIRLKNVRIPAEDVLAGPEQFEAYIQRIKPGFVLSQIGMGLGITQASLQTMRECNATHSLVNQYLDDQEPTLRAELDALDAATRDLAENEATAPLLSVLRARARASELTLQATQSAALHAGAKGYLMRHPAQRRLREALFVAIVTPALKHLRKEIQALEIKKAA